MSHLEKPLINVTVLVKISDTFNVSIDQLILGRNREVGALDSKHVREGEQCKEAIIHRMLKLNYFDGFIAVYINFTCLHIEKYDTKC